MCELFESEQLGKMTLILTTVLWESQILWCALWTTFKPSPELLESSDWNTQSREGTDRSKNSDLQIPPVTFH